MTSGRSSKQEASSKLGPCGCNPAGVIGLQPVPVPALKPCPEVGVCPRDTRSPVVSCRFLRGAVTLS
eukprot:4624672-Karenia_brevis.AAC.1